MPKQGFCPSKHYYLHCWQEVAAASKCQHGLYISCTVKACICPAYKFALLMSTTTLLALQVMHFKQDPDPPARSCRPSWSHHSQICGT